MQKMNIWNVMEKNENDALQHNLMYIQHIVMHYWLVIQYLIGEDHSGAFFGAQEDTLFAFESGQFRVDVFNVIHENQFGLRVGLVVKFQPVGI